jgi:pimeloyl-ACP methyl ester carboxylesterase
MSEDRKMNMMTLKIEEYLKLGKVLLNYKLARYTSSGKLASYVWFTPLRIPASFESFETIVRPFEIKIDNIHTYTFEPEGEIRSVVVLVHGWGGSSRQFQKMINELLLSHHKVICFDFPSHGKTKGLSSDIWEMKNVLNKVLNSVSGEYNLICHSFGLLVAGQVLKNHPHKIKKIISIASPVTFDHIVNQFLMKTKLKIEREALINSIQQRVKDKIDVRKDIDLHSDQFIDLHCMFIHDENDKEVPVSEFDKLKSFKADAETFITQGMGHNKILNSDLVLKEIIRFLSK